MDAAPAVELTTIIHLRAEAGVSVTRSVTQYRLPFQLSPSDRILVGTSVIAEGGRESPQRARVVTREGRRVPRIASPSFVCCRPGGMSDDDAEVRAAFRTLLAPRASARVRFIEAASSDMNTAAVLSV